MWWGTGRPLAARPELFTNPRFWPMVPLGWTFRSRLPRANSFALFSVAPQTPGWPSLVELGSSIHGELNT
jgi:hypothetical protein